jgi:hypothetical protein
MIEDIFRNVSIISSLFLIYLKAIKPSNSDLPNDPKLLKAQILDLHKKLDTREETMNELNQKLTRKSEECGYLVDEMDTVRRRNSVDLQQVKSHSCHLVYLLSKPVTYVHTTLLSCSTKGRVDVI